MKHNRIKKFITAAIALTLTLASATMMYADTAITDTPETNVFDNPDSGVEAKPVIIDTDFASDGDDIVALRLALIYEEMGIIDIKGVALSTCYSRTPKAVSALCEHDGHKGMTIAMNDKEPVHVNTNYVDVLAEYGGNSGYVDPVKMYRKILSESTEKVDILTLGFMQNIEDLMNSAPDEYSPLTGNELIMEKVDNLYILGGNLKGIPSFNFYWTGEKVVSAAQNVNKLYPGNIIYLPTELGGDVWNMNDYKTKDIVYAGLKANHQGNGIIGWDTMGVYCMINDILGTTADNALAKISGWYYISDNGSTVWNNDDSITNRQIMMKQNEGNYYSSQIDSVLFTKFDRRSTN